MVRNEVCNKLQNEKIHKSNHTPKDFKEKTIHKFLKDKKIFLKNNPEVLTLRADKEAYEIRNNGDPTESIQNRLNRMVSGWEKKGSN